MGKKLWQEIDNCSWSRSKFLLNFFVFILILQFSIEIFVLIASIRITCIDVVVNRTYLSDVIRAIYTLFTVLVSFLKVPFPLIYWRILHMLTSATQWQEDPQRGTSLWLPQQLLSWLPQVSHPCRIWEGLSMLPFTWCGSKYVEISVLLVRTQYRISFRLAK